LFVRSCLHSIVVGKVTEVVPVDWIYCRVLILSLQLMWNNTIQWNVRSAVCCKWIRGACCWWWLDCSVIRTSRWMKVTRVCM